MTIEIPVAHGRLNFLCEGDALKKNVKYDLPEEHLIDDSYGSKIKELRIRNGLTQSYVAESLGVTPGYISNVENNRTAMSLRVLIFYAKLTGLSLDELVGELEDDYKPTALDNKLLEKISTLSDEQKEKLLSTIDILF